MAKWNRQETEIDLYGKLEQYRPYRILVEIYAEGTKEEPTLVLDGEPVIKLMKSGRSICEMKIQDFKPDERKKINAAIDKLLEDTLECYYCDITQDIIESEADAYDHYRELDYE